MPGMFRLLLCALLLAAGCSAPKRTYSVVVRNDTDRDLTVWLTKDGPPREPEWKSPEDLAIESRRSDERISGVVLAPGRTADSGQVIGTFARDTLAVLRVYEGVPTFSDLLAISRGDPRRADLVLDPGSNHLRVVDAAGRLVIERVDPPTP